MTRLLRLLDLTMTYRPGLFPVVILLLLTMAAAAMADTNLTIHETRSRALEFNRGLLSAKEDVAIARTDVTKAKADALPNLRLNAGYNRNFSVASSFVTIGDQTEEFQFGFKNSFDATVSLEQAIWHGGKVFSALKIAKMYRGYSDAIADQVAADVVFAADQLFYAAILANTQLDVLNKAFESNSANLEVIEKKYSRGVVSEYEVLRARVEKQNLQPQILNAESEVRLSRKRLKSFLGIDLSEPVTLIEDQTDTALTSVPALPSLVSDALRERPEMKQAGSLRDISKKAIGVARADYWPSLDLVGAYSWSAGSDDFTLSDNRSDSWTAGVRLSLNIFDGFRTRGNVTQRKAEYNQTRLNLKQTEDDIRLEVEAAYDVLMQAKRALEIQGATIDAAEEGLKIAQLRYSSGVGTQLEVLSAQTALTQARQAQAQALYQFRVARAGLKKATTLDMDTDR